jgi:TonB family protein
MALTGQLSDMSLAELIEFFCNQRKTGRLKIDYQRGHSVFFIKDGELVDAKVGTLSGAEAVYYSLTLPNAAFDFSPEVLPTRRSINEPWTQVVLEGLRRLDEGLSPSDADAFGNWTPSEADVAQMMDHVERLGEANSAKDAGQKAAASDSADVPLSFMVDSAAAGGGSRKKFMVMGVAVSVVLICAVAAVPLMRGSGGKPAESAAAPAPAAQPAAPAEAAPAEAAANPSAEPTAPAEAGGADAAAAEAARREREERERRDRKRKAEEAARKDEAAKAAPTPAPVAAGPKSVRVTVNYDENGRVTQASVAGASAGAEAYGGTAVRIARGKRFPAGKAGSTVVTIPVN